MQLKKQSLSRLQPELTITQLKEHVPKLTLRKKYLALQTSDKSDSRKLDPRSTRTKFATNRTVYTVFTSDKSA